MELAWRPDLLAASGAAAPKSCCTTQASITGFGRCRPVSSPALPTFVPAFPEMPEHIVGRHLEMQAQQLEQQLLAVQASYGWSESRPSSDHLCGSCSATQARLTELKDLQDKLENAHQRLRFLERKNAELSQASSERCITEQMLMQSLTKERELAQQLMDENGMLKVQMGELRMSAKLQQGMGNEHSSCLRADDMQSFEQRLSTLQRQLQESTEAQNQLMKENRFLRGECLDKQRRQERHALQSLRSENQGLREELREIYDQRSSPSPLVAERLSVDLTGSPSFSKPLR